MRNVNANRRSSGSAASLQSGLKKVNAMIDWGRRLGYTQAALNLEQWRDAKGDRVMPASSFSSEQFLRNHLRNKHRPRFIEGARKRLQNGMLAPGKKVEMDWTDSVNAPLNSDLWFALGGFTVHSHVTVTVAPAGGNAATLRFVSWQTDISDTYNWDAGKATFIPGIGRVTDDEMLALEKAGYGKAFRITSEKATISDAPITGDETL
jgi:hypothetical protein